MSQGTHWRKEDEVQDMSQNCKASCKKNQGAAGLRLLPEKDPGDMKLTACHANGLRETRQGSKPLAISLG